MLAIQPSFSWLLPWYPPVIFLRALYSNLLMGSILLAIFGLLKSSAPQVKVGLMAPVYRNLSAKGLMPPLELPRRTRTPSRLAALWVPELDVFSPR